jgi:hypothetical protein
MPKTKDQKQAKKDKDYNILVHTRRMRAALHQVERVLRWDPDLTYSLQDVTANGMIRKRYIREALIEHPHVITVQNKKKTNARFKWNGPPFNANFRGRAPIGGK